MAPSDCIDLGRESDDVGLLRLVTPIAAVSTKIDRHDHLGALVLYIGTEAGINRTEFGL